MAKICQSCAGPLMHKGRDFRGTNRDNTKSEKYCCYCYGNGAFIQPDLTCDEMIQVGLARNNAQPTNKFVKWLFKKSYPMQVVRLERWQDK